MDYNKRHREENRSSRNVVYQTNIKNLMDRKETQCKCIERGREGNVQRSLLKTIRKRQMEFLGHVCRRRGLEFLSLTGKVEGKRDRGKQRITFLDSLCNSATSGQSKGLNFCLFQIWHLMMMMMILKCSHKTESFTLICPKIKHIGKYSIG